MRVELVFHYCQYFSFMTLIVTYFFLTMKAVTPTHKTGLMTGPLPTAAGEAGTGK